MGIPPEDLLSPGLLRKVVGAGTRQTSFRQASQELLALAEVSVSEERVRRATERIGEERVAQRDEAVQQWSKLPFPERDKSPTGQSPPVACIQADGGRVQILDATADTDQPPNERRGRFWRETRVACLTSMFSETHTEDPCPELPETFANFAHMAQLTRDLKGAAGLRVADASAASGGDADRAGPSGGGASNEGERCPPPESRLDEEQTRRGAPRVLVRSVVASRVGWALFGPLVATAAWLRGFSAAPRRAFLGDGSAAIWRMQQRYFSSYVPILDFVHAVAYLFRSACAGRALDEAVGVYRGWARDVWQGRVDQVIGALKTLQNEVGMPSTDESESSPRAVVAETLGYLNNQRERMRYDEYRRQGLPITTAYIESTIKQINRRLKGSEKFWKTPGAEALLQLVADELSEHQPLDRYWKDRLTQATGHRRPRAATR